MAYDEALAQRFRDLLWEESDVTEQRMFGGLAFLLNGNMAVAASREGGLLLRIDPEETEYLLAEPRAHPHGDARKIDAGLAPGRRRRRADYRSPSPLGEARRNLRPVTAP